MYESKQQLPSKMFLSLPGAMACTTPTVATLLLSGEKVSPKINSTLSWGAMFAASEAAYKTFCYTQPLYPGSANLLSSQHPKKAGKRFGKRMVGTSHIAAASFVRSKYVLLAE